MGFFGKVPKLSVLKKKAEKIKKKIDDAVEADDDLERVGDSDFFMSKDEAKDPNYEDPIAKMPVGFEWEIVKDDCNFGGQINGVVAFLRLPSFQFVWRNPACQPPPSEPVPDDLLPLPKPKIPENKCNSSSQSYGIPQVVVFQSDTSYHRQAFVDRFFDRRVTWEKFNKSIRIQEVKFFPGGEYSHHITFTSNVNWEYNKAYAESRRLPYPSIHKGLSHTAIFGIKRYVSGYVQPIDGSQYVYVDPWGIYGVFVCSHIYYDFFANGTGTYSGDWFYKNHNFFRNYSDIEEQYEGYTTIENVSSQFHVFCGDYKRPPEPPPPLPPPKMECCPGQKNNDQLLKLILKKIGSENLPASVPRLLTKKDAGIIQINSLAEFISYTVKQIDAVAGRYPLEIKIKDADLTQEGDQEKKITVPNIGEALLEIMGMLLVLQSESSANLIASVNSMVEAGSAKQSAILAADYGRGNSEYLGYKGKQVERNIPFTFKPGEAQMDKMLVSGEVKVKGWENDDKEDLNDALAPLLEFAAMWKAANFKNLGTSDTLGKLKSILTGAVDLTSAVDKLVKTPPPPDPNNPDAPMPEAKKNDWDSFVEEAEQGFIAQPGITDTTHPYARPLEQRPKIREIGNDTSDEPTGA